MYRLPSNVAQHTLATGQMKIEDFAAVGIHLPPHVHGAVTNRQLEWLTGRYAAQIACQSIPFSLSQPLGTRKDRSPDWPPEITGSITHKGSSVSAAVAFTKDYRAIGIDCEPILIREVIAEIEEQILGPSDVTQNPVLSYEQLVTIGFSAKESLYKCLAPLTGKFFTHRDATLTEISGERFTMELLVDLSAEFREGQKLSGTYRILDNSIYTAMTIKQI